MEETFQSFLTAHYLVYIRGLRGIDPSMLLQHLLRKHAMTRVRKD